MVEIYMPDDNSLSIEHYLQPIVYISWLLGVGIAHPRKWPKIVTIIIRIVHLALCTFSFIKLFYNFASDSKKDKFNEFCGVIALSINIIYHVSSYYYIYHGIKHHDKWSKLMDKIKEVDQKIKRETHINIKPLKILEIVAIIVTFTCCPLLLFVHALYNFIYSSVVEKDLLSYYILAQSTINCFVFDVVVYILYHRYQMINKLLGQMDELSGTSKRIAFKIKCIREMHYDICDLVVMISDIHGFYLFIVSINCVDTVGLAVFEMIEMIQSSTMCNDKEIDVLKSIFFLIMYIMQFYVTYWICKLIYQEFDKTGIIICGILLKCKSVNLDTLNETRNQLNLEVRLPMKDLGTQQRCYSCSNLNYVAMENLLRQYPNREWSSQNLDCVRNEINDFSIQLQHRRIACNFFEVNNFINVIKLTYVKFTILACLAILTRFYKLNITAGAVINSTLNSTKTLHIFQ
ncbi:uncharacterized protein LOC118646953 [Monomorium pharaonis]|uniref:uncharacterized protein LOC118646953 n=1 Tax=Monomorium pharaonis TaxID=307658 RepID=UPI00174703D9|nr:uncharacterized protein LOC118646953 [Monomorium pharaonis]